MNSCLKPVAAFQLYHGDNELLFDEMKNYPGVYLLLSVFLFVSVLFIFSLFVSKGRQILQLLVTWCGLLCGEINEINFRN